MLNTVWREFANKPLHGSCDNNLRFLKVCWIVTDTMAVSSFAVQTGS